MTINEPRQTCCVCNGTGDIPVRVREELDALRRRMVMLEERNDAMSAALIAIHTMKSKRPANEQLAVIQKRVAGCEPFWGYFS